MESYIAPLFAVLFIVFFLAFTFGKAVTNDFIGTFILLLVAGYACFKICPTTSGAGLFILVTLLGIVAGRIREAKLL